MGGCVRLGLGYIWVRVRMALDENVVVCGMGGYGLVWLELDGVGQD